MNRKILITGANGFIGKYVTKRFLQAGFTVYAAGRKKPDLIAHAHFIHIDLLETINFDALFLGNNFTHLVHLAWFTEHGKYWTSNQNVLWRLATVNLVKSFCKNGGKIALLSGTCAEYGDHDEICDEYLTPVKPETIYGVEKNITRIEASKICAEFECKFIWIRIFYPFGDGQDSRKLIPSLVSVFDGKTMPFKVNQKDLRDFIHVKDISSAIYLLIKNMETGIFNISTKSPVSITDIVQILACKYNRNPDLVLRNDSDFPIKSSKMYGENDRLLRTGWRQQNFILEYLKSYVPLED